MLLKFKKELCENFMKENNLSKTAFCKLCKINLDTYYRILNGQGKFRINALCKISKVINKEVYEMFN